MRNPLGDSDADYDSLRGDPVPSIDNFLRWERIKLREASQEAIRLLESSAAPTREYLDYMFTTDVGMNEIRARIAKHRSRIAELEAIKAAAEMEV